MDGKKAMRLDEKRTDKQEAVCFAGCPLVFAVLPYNI